MGILGKDLFDFQRPLTHTKVQFGRDAYWVENQPEPQPYGATLVQLLNYDAEDYLHRLDALRASLKAKDHNGITQSARAVVDGFARLPLYRLYIEEVTSLELLLFCTDNTRWIAQRLLKDKSTLEKYFQAADDLQMIQKRYIWFLEELFQDQTPEKKKGQRKEPLAKQIIHQNLEAFLSGVSLGGDAAIDAPPVNVQYAMLESNGTPPEIVEKMYFDRLADFVYVEFMKGLQRGFVPKCCPNCGRWFLQQPGMTYSYCDSLAPGETSKTCRDVGATASFKEKSKNNEVWTVHQRAYKKYYARTMKKTLRKTDFEVWAREAEALREEALVKYERTSSIEERTAIAAGLAEALNKL